MSTRQQDAAVAQATRPRSPDRRRARSHDALPGAPAAAEDSIQFSTGILRKKLYDQNLSDWVARYRKNKQNLDAVAKDCEMLRFDVSKSQAEVDGRADGYKQLEEQYETQILAKFQDTKTAYEAAVQQRGSFQVQISENRKQRTQLTREKKLLANDYERKHAELMRMAEVHDKLDAQLAHITQQLAQLTTDRRRMERELDEVQNNLRANTELADEVTNHISHVQVGIKDSVDLHMAPAVRLEAAAGGSSMAQASYLPHPSST